ncbi:MAG: PocR ligand-binding domain-containing protein, partial [Rhodocyclaceae bacterium]|nr:PocR ligand-binding domain-containing protein [Rhodocyclaceae bacterium]
MQDGSDFKYSDLVEASKLQALLESFQQVLGMANAVIDTDGVVIAQAGWQDACVHFHRVHPETCRRCIESDTSLAQSMTEGKPYAIYHCLNGLVDTAAPIIVAGRHVANVFTGQFFTAPPDLEFFRAQARRFGFDEAAYLEAIARVPVLEHARVESMTRLYAQLAATLADSGLDRLKQQRASEALKQMNAELEGRIAARTAELAARESLLRQIMDTSSVAIACVDDQGRITHANRRTAEMFGYPPDRLIGLAYVDLLPPAEREQGKN